MVPTGEAQREALQALAPELSRLEGLRPRSSRQPELNQALLHLPRREGEEEGLRQGLPQQVVARLPAAAGRGQPPAAEVVAERPAVVVAVVAEPRLH